MGLGRRPGVWIILLLSGVAGCERAAPPPATQPAEPIVVQLDSPQNAAKALLIALRDTVRAAARGDAAAVAALKRRTLEIVDPVSIGTNYVRVLGGRAANLTDAQLRAAAEGVIAHWPSMIAFYIEGLDLEHIEPLPATVGNAAMNVALHATGEGRSAVLRVATLRDEQGQWRPIGLDFVAQHTATRPSAATPAP
ncbi:MAG: hypothetical protein AB7Q17_10425 [Phycisphaerae bacterium]